MFKISLLYKEDSMIYVNSKFCDEIHQIFIIYQWFVYENMIAKQIKY